jgi:hypothetical protein
MSDSPVTNANSGVKGSVGIHRSTEVAASFRSDTTRTHGGWEIRSIRPYVGCQSLLAGNDWGHFQPFEGWMLVLG